jgi:low affinity Fe/Cu permease
MRARFDRLTAWVSEATGSPIASGLAWGFIATWLIGAAVKDLWTDTTYNWIINSATNAITFLMVFALQATQNREAKAQHVKLDAILAALPNAPNALMAAEDLPTEQLTQTRDELRGIAPPDQEAR